MIIEEYVDVKVVNTQIKYYESKGYVIPKHWSKEKRKMVYDSWPVISVRIEDLPLHSTANITARCDVCGKEKRMEYKVYMASYNKHNYYCCQNCAPIKRKDTFIEKFGTDHPLKTDEIKEKVRHTCQARYGVDNPHQIDSVKKKISKTCMERYGYSSIGLVPSIQEKAHATNLKKYGSEYVMGTDYFKDKSKEYYTNKYGEGITHCSQVDEVKIKKSELAFLNGTCRSSAQQRYICDLYKGVLNAPFNSFNLDILLDDIDIEVDFSGHNLCVKLGEMTQDEFYQKEIVRNSIIKRSGLKQIHLISSTDKIPSDEILLQILDISKSYFSSTNHTWIEWYFDENKYRNAENRNGVFFDFGILRKLHRESA